MVLFFSDINIDGNKKPFPPFKVCGNDAVTEWSLSPNFEVWLMKFSGFFLLDSVVNSWNWLNNNLRFGGGLSVNILLLFVYFPTEDSFSSELLWMNEWKFCWGFQKEMFHWYI